MSPKNKGLGKGEVVNKKLNILKLLLISADIFICCL